LRKTLAREVSATGIALHAGVKVRMTLSPTGPGAGIVFRRADLARREIPALYDRVGETRLGTVLGGGDLSIAVVEHLMAAIAGAEIDDLLVTLDGPEPPILDGDALAYLALIDQAGISEQAGPRTAIKVLRRVEVLQQEARVALIPHERLEYAMEIAFAAAAIGSQTFSFVFSPQGFRAEIAPARTFGFLSELEALNRMNLAKGASLENTLAIDGDRVVNAGLLRFADEFVRHKILDAIGDMALAGAPLIARFEGVRSGHAANNALLRALFADRANYALVTL
jgi:UDP-3-O-[3-hydroxymyristoyl] N-acetylglucosamine deacetylase